MTDQLSPEIGEPMPAALAFPLSRFGEEVFALGFQKGFVITAAMVTAHNERTGNYSRIHDPLGNPRAIVPETLIATMWERFLAIPVPEIEGYQRCDVMPSELVFRCPVKVGEKVHLRVRKATGGLSKRGDPAMFLDFEIVIDKQLPHKEPDEPVKYKMALVVEGIIELRFIEMLD